MSVTHKHQDFDYCFLRHHKGNNHDFNNQYLPHDYSVHAYQFLTEHIGECEPAPPCEGEPKISSKVTDTDLKIYGMKRRFPYAGVSYEWSFTFNHAVHEVTTADINQLAALIKEKIESVGAAVEAVNITIDEGNGLVALIEILATDIFTSSITIVPEVGEPFSYPFNSENVKEITVSILFPECRNPEITWIVNGEESQGDSVTVLSTVDFGQAIITCADGCKEYVELSFSGKGKAPEKKIPDQLKGRKLELTKVEKTVIKSNGKVVTTIQQKLFKVRG